MRRRAKLAIIGTTVVALGAIAAPALANQSVGVSVGFLTAGPTGTRTLSVQDTRGNDLTATGAVLDLSGGSNSFVTKVIDSNAGYLNTGYTVQAMMSNLYPYNGTAFTSCNQLIQSKQLTLSSPTGLLNLSGITAGLTPVFSLSGNLASILTGLLPAGSNGIISNQTVQGTAQSLSQGQIASGNAGNLFGSTLASVLGQLPIQPAANPAGGSFNSPAQDPTGANCNNGNNATATQVPIMTGTTDPTGLISDLNSVILSATNPVTSNTPTAQDLVTALYLDPNAVLTMVCQKLTVACGLLTPLQQTQILNTLNDNLLTAPITLVGGLTGQSGTYSAQPGVVINTQGIIPGGYRGTMTVTLVTN